MITNDRYVAMLEKMAGDEDVGGSQITKEYDANRKENRTYLGGLFNRAGEVEQQMTASAGRVLSAKNESGSPFIKTSARHMFDQMTYGAEWAKTASPVYMEVAFHSFYQELEKLAARR